MNPQHDPKESNRTTWLLTITTVIAVWMVFTI